MGLEKLAKTIKSEIKKQEETLAERFINELDLYLIRSRVAERETQEAKTGKYIRPSSYHKCLRQLWYKMKSFPCKENNTAKGIRTLEIGTSLHEWVQRDIFMKPDAPFPYVPVNELPFLNREGVELFTEKQSLMKAGKFFRIFHLFHTFQYFNNFLVTIWKIFFHIFQCFTTTDFCTHNMCPYL